MQKPAPVNFGRRTLLTLYKSFFFVVPEELAVFQTKPASGSRRIKNPIGFPFTLSSALLLLK